MAEDTTENTDNKPTEDPVYDDDGMEITDLTNFERAQMAIAKEEEANAQQEANPGGEDSTDAKNQEGTTTEGESQDESGKEGDQGEATFEVKVNGEVKQVSLADLQNNYSLGAAARDKMREASDLNKQAIEFIQALKDNPLAILTDERLGLDFGAVVDKFNAQRKEYGEMSEDQQQLVMAQQRLKQYERQQEINKQNEAETFQAQQVADITKQIDGAISQGGLPNNTFVFNRYIEYLQNADSQGINVSPTALTEMVKEDYQEALKEMLGQSEVPDIINLLGDRVKDIRKYEVDAIKNDTNRVTDTDDDGKPTKKKKGDKKGLQSLEDFKESIGIFG